MLAGKGIANLFMRPYNFKVWAFPTTMVQYLILAGGQQANFTFTDAMRMVG